MSKHQKTDKSEHFYPLLSIDPKNKPQQQHDFHCESLDYLNVKFDTRRELRDTYIKNFKEKIAVKLFRNSCESLSDKNQQQTNEKKSTIIKKKILNPQQLIHSTGQKTIKQSAFSHKHRLSSSYHQKKSISFTQDCKQKEDVNQISKPKCFVFNQLAPSADDQKSFKRKKQIYQKMLKKVDQLREIYKYEAELINITEINDDIPLRFHTQPIAVDFTLKQQENLSIKRKQSKPLKIPRKLSPQNRESLYRTDDNREISPQNRTLEVRKYRNDTSIKKRMKYLLRKQLMKQGLSLSDQKSTHNANKGKEGRKIVDKDAVGPWDAQQSIYFLKEY